MALTLIPRAVASSIASTPAAVVGNFTMMFGARATKPSAWATIAAASRKRVGSVCIESRPARPAEASKAGRRSGAASTLISATIAQASSRSDQVGCTAARAATRSVQRGGSLRQLSTTIVGFAVAPTAPNDTA